MPAKSLSWTQSSANERANPADRTTLALPSSPRSSSLRSMTFTKRRRRRTQLDAVQRGLTVLLLACYAVAFVAAFRPPSLPRLSERDYARIENLQSIADVVDAGPTVNYTEPTSLLSKILIPRVPESDGNTLVRATLVAPFLNRKSNWTVQEHKFVATTPQGEKQMTNLIITYNAQAPRKLVLAAHHDSKVSPEGFIGATDSAVPCAIMVDTALAFEKLIEGQQNGTAQLERAQQTALQLIFFDGEEAYLQWTETDSVYGSRALADHWSKTFFSPQILTKRRTTPGYATMRFIDSIEQFVLLDLLGTPHPRIPSYYFGTKWMHDELRSIEERLASSGLLYPRSALGTLQLPPGGGFGTPKLPPLPGVKDRATSFFTTSAPMGGIDDDHRPFLQNGVPILHLIPSPFPAVWHTMADDARSLDYPTIYAWTMIMRVFVAEYFGLQVGAGGGGITRGLHDTHEQDDAAVRRNRAELVSSH